MNNFGVIELASTKTTNAPGWAYVPDTTNTTASSSVHRHPSASTSISRNKRAARNTGAGLSNADISTRQEAKIRRELEALDRDNLRADVSIPVPAKKGGGAAAAAAKKHTSNVRRILQSQKTFRNHLDDFLALGGENTTSASAGAGAGGSSTTTTTAIQQSTASTITATTTTRVKQEDQDPEPTADSIPTTTTTTTTTQQQQVPSSSPQPHSHPQDANPLLQSRVPPAPTAHELRALTTAAAAHPLSYLEAGAGWGDEDRRYPTRRFCEVCGYWGRVRCGKCGARVCALDCLEAHREECVGRYGM
ncbi:hypothetical protein F4778DRAFT_715030 [Xylariomycetidae sp. FL2044]|nr:hypothetical protein F4778DRAFT_715030 [Xylariomycetidae sp. FL2044]